MQLQSGTKIAAHAAFTGTIYLCTGSEGVNTIDTCCGLASCDIGDEDPANLYAYFNLPAFNFCATLHSTTSLLSASSLGKRYLHAA